MPIALAGVPGYEGHEVFRTGAHHSESRNFLRVPLVKPALGVLSVIRFAVDTTILRLSARGS